MSSTIDMSELDDLDAALAALEVLPAPLPPPPPPMAPAATASWPAPTGSEPATLRIDPPDQADESTMLRSFLDYQRATLLSKADGLTEAQARTASVPPSELTMTGLVRHMAEVERNWFQRWFVGGEIPGIYCDDDDIDGDFHVLPSDTLDEALRIWDREVRMSRAIAGAARPDDLAVGSGLSSELRGFRPSMRWILIHMIQEYARHCGHADLIRERIDGVVGA